GNKGQSSKLSVNQAMITAEQTQEQMRLLYEQAKGGQPEAIKAFRDGLKGILSDIENQLKLKREALKSEEVVASIIEQEMQQRVMPYLEQQLRDKMITQAEFDDLKAQGPSILKDSKRHLSGSNSPAMKKLGLDYRYSGSRDDSIDQARDVLMHFQEFTQLKQLSEFIRNLDGDFYHQHAADIFPETNRAATFIDAVNIPYSRYRVSIWGEYDMDYKEVWRYLRSSPLVTDTVPLTVFEDLEAQSASYSVNTFFGKNEESKGFYHLFWLASINSRLRVELVPMLITMSLLYGRDSSFLSSYLKSLTSEEIGQIEAFNIPGLLEIINDARGSKEGWTDFSKETIKDALFRMGLALASGKNVNRQWVGVAILSTFNWEFLRPRISIEQQIELERRAQNMLEVGVAESKAAELLTNLGNLGLHTLLGNLKPEQKNNTLILNAIRRGYDRLEFSTGQSLGIEQTVAPRLMELASSGSREALALLGQMGRHIRGMDDFLINLYEQQKDRYERKIIVSALGGVGTPKAVDFINKLLAETIEKKDYYEADEYIQALSKAGPAAATAVGNIVKAYQIIKERKFEGSRGDDFYRSIFHALVNSGTRDPQVLPVLFDGSREMSRTRYTHRNELVKFLKNFGVEIIPFIVELRESGGWYYSDIRESVDQLILNLGRPALAFLKGQLEGVAPDDVNPTVLEFIALTSKNEIYRMAGLSEFSGVKETLIRIAQATTNNNIRSAAIRVLADLGLSVPDEFITWARGQLEDKKNEPYVRVACARLFIKNTETYEWFLPLLVSFLDDETEKGDIRNQLHGVVWNLEPRELRKLEEIYNKSPDANVRREVMTAFGVNKIDSKTNFNSM
ncbi:MAG: hypothetical protein WCH62_07945, partial [Candidatus Omnitrophota bacterium]